MGEDIPGAATVFLDSQSTARQLQSAWYLPSLVSVLKGTGCADVMRSLNGSKKTLVRF